MRESQRVGCIVWQGPVIYLLRTSRYYVQGKSARHFAFAPPSFSKHFCAPFYFESPSIFPSRGPKDHHTYHHPHLILQDSSNTIQNSFNDQTKFSPRSLSKFRLFIVPYPTGIVDGDSEDIYSINDWIDSM